MVFDPNPFLKVYNGVYDLLFGGVDNPLAALIKPGNRVTYGSLYTDRNVPLKDSIQTGDTPELILVDEGGMLQFHANSSGGKFDQSIGLYISTGDFSYAGFASAINWYIWCNVNRWGTTLAELTWNGEHFVKAIQIVQVQIGESNPERNRNIKGWNAIWRIQLELRIAHANLTYTEV